MDRLLKLAFLFFSSDPLVPVQHYPSPPSLNTIAVRPLSTRSRSKSPTQSEYKEGLIAPNSS